jgi:2-phospho-L-lactate transferase/gluconeogenesis factor (CofD/UPF0052 family)
MAIKVVLFCGGRGSATIIRELLRTSEVQLALLVNAYDDGLSTGALRNFIPGMLGPSDFRKNFSYLLDLYSDAQYALKNLIEYRLPLDFGATQIGALEKYVRSGNPTQIAKPLSDLIAGLEPAAADQVRRLLKFFLDYANGSAGQFDFRDCAVGNLLFAGAYLSQGRNFNAAAEQMSRLVSSQSVLVNVSNGENRILVALKEDGELLSREVEIVGPQSAVPIRNLFFMAEPLSENEVESLGRMTIEEKTAWLAAREALPELSEEARRFIREADLIVYGPGTQHSSLFPSYRIAASALRQSRAAMKVLTINLGPDHDIQGLNARALADRALAYAGDPENDSRTVTHILIQEESRKEPSGLETMRRYKGAEIVRGIFAGQVNPYAHSGHAVVSRILALRRHHGLREDKPSLEVFYDLSRRPAGEGLVEEFLEYKWRKTFRRVVLRVHGKLPKILELPDCLGIEEWHCEGFFPEVAVVADWLRAGGSDYLATITGDGEYRLRDIAFGVRMLEQGSFGAVYGSRTQSRMQFNSSLRAAYGERGLAYRFSFGGAFVLSMLFAARFGLIFSDPMTGFRIYRRAKLQPLENLLGAGARATPTTITKLLVQNRIEIAELPVQYRTFAGFTDPKWRVRRGLHNLMGIFR